MKDKYPSSTPTAQLLSLHKRCFISCFKPSKPHPLAQARPGRHRNGTWENKDQSERRMLLLEGCDRNMPRLLRPVLPDACPDANTQTPQLQGFKNWELTGSDGILGQKGQWEKRWPTIAQQCRKSPCNTPGATVLSNPQSWVGTTATENASTPTQSWIKAGKPVCRGFYQ